MRLQVTLALICVLFPKVLAIKCYQCIPELFGQCTDTLTDCPDQCDSKTAVVTMGTQQHEMHLKTCAPAKQCVSGSINLGLMKMTFDTKCCSTDLCNKQRLPALPKGSPNGKKCYACDDKDCSGTVGCEGNEDRCFSATVNTGGAQMTVKGCVSRSLCAGDDPSIQDVGITGGVNCCEGNLCNSAKIISLSFLIMLVPLLPSILFLGTLCYNFLSRFM